MAHLEDVSRGIAAERKRKGIYDLRAARLGLRRAARTLDGMAGHHETLMAMAAVDDGLAALDAGPIDLPTTPPDAVA